MELNDTLTLRLYMDGGMQNFRVSAPDLAQNLL